MMSIVLQFRGRLRVMPSLLFEKRGRFVPRRPPPWPSWKAFVLARRSRCVLFTFFPITIRRVFPPVLMRLSSFSPLHLPPIVFLFYACLSPLVHSRAAEDASTSQEKRKDTSKIRKRYIRFYVFSDTKILKRCGVGKDILCNCPSFSCRRHLGGNGYDR